MERGRLMGTDLALMIADIKRVSQLFWRFKSTDMLEISLLLDKNFKPQYLGVSKNKTGAEYKQ
jgi:hypothetical protein